MMVNRGRTLILQSIFGLIAAWGRWLLKKKKKAMGCLLKKFYQVALWEM